MSVFATSYFPSSEYLKEMCCAENPIVDLGEHYIKQTFRNRCSILTSNGMQNLSIPVVKPDGNKTRTKDILVTQDLNWRRDHWRTIKAAYSSAPYFEHYETEIKNLVFQETEKLWEFNQNIMKQLISWLELPLSYTYSEKFIELSNSDFRDFQFEKINKTYTQVLFNQDEFFAELSILDSLFCLGPLARNLIFNSIDSKIEKPNFNS